MKSTPILFSAPMIRASLAGLKTNTRRIIKPQPDEDGISRDTQIAGHNNDWFDTSERRYVCPYGGPGDELWFREAWRVGKGYDELPGSAFTVPSLKCLHYEADSYQDTKITWGRYRHARFMPRWASRMTATIKDVRVERVQDISKEDAIAEGFTCLSKDIGSTYKYGIPDKDGLPGNDDHGWHWHDWEVDPRHAYERLWGKINGADSWALNPWVWAVTYEIKQQ